MRVGIFGGAFNPVHIGHLCIAHEVAQLLCMEKVYFVISGSPPHKEDNLLMGASHRYKMVQLACLDNPTLSPSKAELQREGPSYTIDTMAHFKSEVGADVHFIAGQDAIEDIGSWKSAATLLKSHNFAIATRPGYDPSTLIEVLQNVLEVKYHNVKLKVVSQSDDGRVKTLKIAGSSSIIHIVNTSMLAISSTDIRERLQNDRSIKYLVPTEVEKYLIKEKGNLFEQ